MRQLSEKEIQNHASEIASQGYSIMEDVIDEAFRSQLLEELDRLESVRPGGDIPPGPFTGFVTRRWFDLLNDSDIWQQVAINQAVLSVLPHVLGEDFLLSTMGSAV
ncbi:MAG: hypothetical protein QF895_05715, partial [SAR86 cluster bacterium]|nr:hypothetical protein [SAR86 cluster bacterium]